MITKNDMEKQPAGIIALGLLIEKLKRGEFQAGQPIRESVLAEEFGLSRNAVREALNQIVGWDIFEYIPYCGYRLRKFTLHDFLEWYEMREAIEPIAARRLALLRPPEVIRKLEGYLEEFEAEAASENYDSGKLTGIDMNFHLTVVENCGNRRFSHMQTIGYFIVLFFCNKAGSSKLVTYVQNSTNQFLPPGFTEKDYTKLNMELTIKKHRKMLDFIIQGKAAEAERCFREHTSVQVSNLQNMIHYLQECNLEEIPSPAKLFSNTVLQSNL